MENAPQLLPATLVKLGGSLLELKDLAARLRGLFSLLERFGGIATVVGGGPAADLVRRWDQQQSFTAHDSHWLAIRAMRLTEQFLAIRAPECGGVVEDLEECRKRLAQHRPVIVSIEPMLKAASRKAVPTPPESWDVTSDTLAAWAARYIGIPRLILAKSVDLPATGLGAATAEGLVDPLFEKTAQGLELLWINLRKDRLQLVPI